MFFYLLFFKKEKESLKKTFPLLLIFVDSFPYSLGSFLLTLLISFLRRGRRKRRRSRRSSRGGRRRRSRKMIIRRNRKQRRRMNSIFTIWVRQI